MHFKNHLIFSSLTVTGLYRGLGRHLKAANAFSKAENYIFAAESYYVAKDYNETATMLERGRCYNLSVAYVTK